MAGVLAGLIPVALLYVTLRWSVAARLLAGLNLWDVPLSDTEQEQSPAKPPARARTSKHGSVASKAAKQVTRFPGAASVTLFNTTSSVVEKHEIFESVQLLVIAWVVLAGTAAFEVLQAHLAGAPVSTLPAWLALAAIPVSLYSLAEVDVFAKVVPAVERWYVLGIGMVGVLAAAGVLFGASDAVLDFDVEAASDQLGESMTKALQRLSPELDSAELETDARVLHTFLMLLAGVISALVANAAMRAARSYELTVRTPQFANEFVHASLWARTGLTLCMAGPPLISLLWATPIFRGIFQLQEREVTLARACSVLAMGAVGLWGARASTQAYLHGSMVQWWTHKHSGLAADDAKARRLSTFIKMKADFINALYCKVAAELAAPALLWLAFGVVLSLNILYRETMLARQPESLWSLSLLWNGTVGFLAWWSCCSWSVFSLFTLALYRMGFLLT